MAASDITRGDVLKAIEFRDDPNNQEFIRSLRFGPAQKYRLVYEGSFYESKEIAGIAHGIATERFWNSDDLSGGVASGDAAGILRGLGFVIDDGPLYELKSFRLYKHQGRPAAYQYVVLLWAISRARSGGPRWFLLSDVDQELALLLLPFAVASSEPEPAHPIMALQKTSWWDSSVTGGKDAGSTVDDHDGVIDDADDLDVCEGLSDLVYERVITDDAFVGAAVDVITRIVGSEPAYEQLLDQLGLANLASFLPDVHKDTGTPAQTAVSDQPFAAYTIDNIIAEGSFHSRERLKQILRHWDGKLNVVLQGAPGTGKTWLAKRLAYALIGSQNADAIRAVQFHPNTSYEDFVRGWRPTASESGTGQLVLADGPLLQHAQRARENPETRHVLIIEEINRGNPAQAFGEMLTLIEATKRSPADALSLSYPRTVDEQYYLPPNLWILGTMNVADRSLALVDFALRRRFAFETLRPAFTRSWEDQLRLQLPNDGDLVPHIRAQVLNLNQTISNDPLLGPQFEIGHSFFTPAETESDGWEWFEGVVHTEIEPLLKEYWFDDPGTAVQAVRTLLDRQPNLAP